MDAADGSAGSQRLRWWVACALIALSALAAYSNSFSGEFVMDDFGSISDNDSIRSLWPPWPVITPLEGGITVGGRPVLNLSFALNYALGGLDVRGYHVVNLGIHVLAGFVLFGLIRRTLRVARLRERFGDEADPIALVVAVLWVLHPIQTESVTYIVQRAESLVGLFYLLTLYCLARGIEEESRLWLSGSILTCVIGMGCKEVMVSAPLVALLYDRTFAAGTFAEAWRRRKAIYLAMAASWVVLAYCVVASGNRGGTAGLGVGPSPLDYLLTQGCAILEYLRLSIWPSPLIADYGTLIITDPGQYILPVILTALLGIATLVGVCRNSGIGFLGVFFFAILAPSSSVVAVATQTIAAHRMYLPLAAVIMVLVLGLYRWIGRRGLWLAPLVAIVFGWLTFERNKDYEDNFAIIKDTIMKSPRNARALGALGVQGLKSNEPGTEQYEIAKSLIEESLSLRGWDLRTCTLIGIQLYGSGKKLDGLHMFLMAYAMDPEGEYRALNVGVAYAGMGMDAEARKYLEAALARDPQDGKAKLELEKLDRKTTPAKP